MLAPVGFLVVALTMPAVVDRMFEGFVVEAELVDTGVAMDEATVTAGRSRIWPYVVEKIKEKPVFGWGRLAMRRTGLARFAHEELGDSFGHPHNAYLELLFDSGIVGFLIVMASYAVTLFLGLRLFRDSRSPVFVAAGGAALALTLAWLGGSIGSQTFYPRQSNLGMWCAIGLMYRVSIERTRALAQLSQEASAQRASSGGTTRMGPRPLQPSPGVGARAPARTQTAESLDERLWVRHTAG
jgi:O-antigen ligase